MKQTTIIGAGAVGRSIALALFAAGSSPDGIYSRNGMRAARLAKSVKAKNFGVLTGAIPLSETVIIAVPDSEIRNVVSVLDKRKDSLFGRVFLHTSGALTSDELLSLKKRGASVGTMHPLQTFSSKRTSTKFTDVYCALEGDAVAVKAARSLVKLIGGKSFLIRKVDKSVYHIAAVFVSNYLVTILSVAEQLGQRIAIPEEQFRKIIRPLVIQTVENVLSASPAEALTGPIKRGDGVTVAKHVRTMEHSKHLKRFLPLYAALGMETAQLAKRRK